jgi:hypothetical protein
MFRSIVAVVVGYLVMAVLTLLAFGLSLIAPDFAFEKDRFDVTPAWLVFALAATLVAAVVGGFVTVVIARRRSAVYALAALVIVLGFGSAAGNLTRDRPLADESAAGLSAVNRGKRAVQPTWYAFTLPIVGAAGVVIGGRLIRERGHR